LWDNDECDFIDVTLGVARLQKLLATFNGSHLLPGLDMRRQVLLAMTPGDQHYFGASMVERFLQAAGWSVEAAFDRSAAEIAAQQARSGLQLRASPSAPNGRCQRWKRRSG